jgi:hypothetical protein
MKSLSPFLTVRHRTRCHLALAGLLASSPLAALAQAPNPVRVQYRIMHLSPDQRW